MGDANGGRIARGWYLLGVSWRFLRRRPALFTFPALSAAFLVLAGLAIFTPLVASTDEGSWKLTFALAAVATAIPATLVTTFCNVAFLAMVQAETRGEQLSFGGALRAASARKGAIVGWSLLSVAVGAVLRLLAQIPGGELIGSVLSFLGGLAWSFATYFVVPVLVMEQEGVFGSIRRSAQTFKARWGESVTGELTAGAALGLLMIPGGVLIGVGAMLIAGEPGAGLVLLVIGIAITAPLIALSSAVTQLFQFVIYREVTDGQVPAPFDANVTAAAFRQKPKRFWKR